MRVSIKGDTGMVSIEVLGYENTNATDLSDANWLSCMIEVEAGSFRGRYRTSLTTKDFACFEKDLSGLLGGEKSRAVFFTDEGWLRLEVIIDFLGRGKVTGEASDNLIPRSALSFAFETERAYLEQTKDSLCKITNTFPVKE